MTLPLRLALLAALTLTACQTEKQAAAPAKPTFYEDLARPGAAVDQSKAAEMISGYRARFGLGPLAIDPELSRIAAGYAADMAAADKMTHALTKESKIGERLKANGYVFVAAGENIAAGYRTLAEAFSGWRDSRAHDEGMKDPDMTVMGIGTAYNPNSKYKVFWCLILARPLDAGSPGLESTPGVGSIPALVGAPTG
jgi:uncharacterized protein YkwD